MADLIDEIIQISITRQTLVASIPNFGDAMVVKEFATDLTTPAFTERVRIYGSLQEILDEGIPASNTIYLAAQALFSQNPNPGRIYVGRKKPDAELIETWTEALTAINAENSDWYGFGLSMAGAALEQAADWAETNLKLHIISDDDPNIIGGTGDIAEYVNTQNYDRSAVIYHPDADLGVDDPFINFAWMGKQFTKDPGSTNWAHQGLNAVAGYDLTTGERSTIEGKNGNFYSPYGGLDATLYGKVGSGEYIDIIRGTDWLEARMKQRIATLLHNSNKIPFDDAGIQTVVAEVLAALQEGVAAQLLLEKNSDGTMAYNVTYPLASDVSAADKADRLLPEYPRLRAFCR